MSQNFKENVFKKALMVCLGLDPGADESTELWRHPNFKENVGSWSPGLVVIGGDSCSSGRGFES